MFRRIEVVDGRHDIEKKKEIPHLSKFAKIHARFLKGKKK